MNIAKLIAAAKQIDKLAEKQEERSKAWHRLAIDARKPGADRHEIQRRKMELDASQVVDFSTAIEELRAALHAS